MILLIQYTLLFASVLMLVALGGCFSEHSGVINLGLEGIMVMGALGGALVMKYLPAGTSAFVIVLLVILASMLMGLIYSSLLGVAGVNFSADQTLVGTAMNMLAAALATVIVKSINVAENPDNVSSTVQYVQAKKALIVNVGGFQFNWFMLVAVILLFASHFILYKTRFGLILRATGEDENVVYAYGADPIRMRYLSVIMGGMLSALGGAQLSIAYTHTWIEGMTGSRGVIGVALVCIAAWNPAKAFIGAYIFGAAQALQMILQQQGLEISSFLLMMIPYVLVLIALFAASIKKNGKMPAELKKVFEAV